MNWKLLLSTFGLLFMAELGDKTQLAVFFMTCEHRKPLPIFILPHFCSSSNTPSENKETEQWPTLRCDNC